MAKTVLARRSLKVYQFTLAKKMARFGIIPV
jgi:hypothetical protein